NNNENPYFILYTKNPFTLQFPKLNDFMLAFLRSYRDPRLEYYFDSVKVVANRYVVTDTLSSVADDSLRIVTYPIPFYGLPKSPVLLSGWTGALAGQINPHSGVNINAYSNPSASIYTNPARPFMILTYAETLLMKAEAKQLGLGGASTAESYYYAGIDANFAFWGIPAARRDAYKQINGIKWGTTGVGFRDYLGITNANIPDGDINKIYIQHWLNYYPDQGFDAWCLQRRTFVITPPPHTNPAYASFTFTEIPYRGTYPTNLQNVNPTGYNDALGKLKIPVGAETTNGYYPLNFMIPHTVKDWNAVTPQFDNSYIRKWYGSTIDSLKAAAISSGFTYTITSTFKL
ncbi:MAG TPA: SusD/RagB family nutrient-binding outer membrane lipoprotein, partial [Flavitalea sp.]|nr:SusD/RagB family nutrient-binding outer membrane lipoprotein [Flavitalea sp.]